MSRICPTYVPFLTKYCPNYVSVLGFTNFCPKKILLLSLSSPIFVTSSWRVQAQNVKAQNAVIWSHQEVNFYLDREWTNIGLVNVQFLSSSRVTRRPKIFKSNFCLHFVSWFLNECLSEIRGQKLYQSLKTWQKWDLTRTKVRFFWDKI